MKAQIHTEPHRSENINWLRAAVLGANDGIVSTSSIIVGVAAAHSSHQNIFIAGIAGLVAGAMSMAAGEYVSVSSQADVEHADLEREKEELKAHPDFEREELAQIYVRRGLDSDLAKKVAEQLMAYDALGSHARDELGITEIAIVHPIQAAFSSAISFSLGGALPLFVIFVFPMPHLMFAVPIASLCFLMILGILAAYVGRANIWKGAFRVGFWGALAMAITAGIGAYFG